jgi:ATP-dependent DNA ligase
MTNYYQGCDGHIDPREIMEFDFSKSVYLAEQKYDGIYCMLTFDSAGKLTLISRNMKEKTNEQLESLRSYLENYFQLKDSVINGELAFSTQAGTEYQKLFGHSKVDLFDILKYKGKELNTTPLIQRKLLLSSLVKKDDEYIKLSPYICSTFEDGSIDKDFNKKVLSWFNKLVKEGKEGLVIKDMNDTGYECGGKSKLWYKIKKLVSMDYIIMDYEDSESDKYKSKGWIKNIVCGLLVNGELVEKVRVGSMTEPIRKEISENKKKYIGTVVEINGFEIFKSGSTRHPSFNRFRDDKDSKDCTWVEEVEEIKEVKIKKEKKK